MLEPYGGPWGGGALSCERGILVRPPLDRTLEGMVHTLCLLGYLTYKETHPPKTLP